MPIARLRFFLSIVLLALSFGAAAAMPDFEQLERKLKIRPEQKEQFDITVGSTRRALLAVGIAALELKDRLASELAKPAPDFRAFARANDDIIEQTRPLFKDAGMEWKKLYALLDDEQIGIAKSFWSDNLGRFIK